MQPNEQRNIDRLAKILNDKELEQNRTTLQELHQFKELFVAQELDQVDYEKTARLSKAFVQRYNPYRPIEVLGPDGQLLFRIPQLFVPVSEVKEDYKRLVNHFQKEGSSEVPKYAAEATRGLLAALIKSQDDAAKEQGFTNYTEYINTVRSEYQRDVQKFKTLKDSGDVSSVPGKVASTKSPQVSTASERNVNVDEVPAISWE